MTRIWPIAAILLPLWGGHAAAQSYETLNQALVDEVVVPAYQSYADAIGRLPASIEALCAAPDPAGLEKARQAWREAMLAWQHAQPVNLGPVVELGLAPQVEFWPDKHGTAGRQYSQALASRDLSLLDAADLPGKSVGLTSLATLERLLFGDALLEPETSDYACGFSLAIARHRAALAGQLVEAWTAPDGFRAAVVGAGPGNALFFSAYDPAAAFYRALSDTLDSAIQVKLEAPLGETIEAARGRRAESWRSQMALPAVAANLETARDLYAAPGAFGDIYLALGGQPEVDGQVRAGFEDALQTASTVPLPLVDAVEDPAARAQVLSLVDQLKQLRLLIRGPVAAGLGMSLGFNATDGD
jgi:predicted lipoprotein